MSFKRYMLVREGDGFSLVSDPNGDLMDAKQVTSAIADRDAEIARLRAELETERMRLVACDTVAMADTPSSAPAARDMRPEYRSAALDSVIRRVDECMKLRAEFDAAKAVIEKWPKTADGVRVSERDKVFTRYGREAYVTIQAEEFECIDGETNSWQETGVSWNPILCYSTREAALAAKENPNVKA